MKRYGFHRSSIFPTKCLIKVTWFGRLGLRIRDIRASSGVRSPLALLHCTHAHTKFSQVSSPPRERGSTWSTVNGKSPLPQNWHRWPSRRRMFLRERIIFLYGTRIYTERRTTLGKGIDSETERRSFPA